ncbi:MAG: serine/threonine-protein phosphatase [Actinomycetota bacterium]|nr:serine/threonine-protein phosphatase [Actinomycetota bacterium]
MDTGPIRAAELADGVNAIIVALIRLSTTLAPDDLARSLSEQVTSAGFLAGSVLLVDHEQRLLTPLPGPACDISAQDVDSTLAGRAFQTERPTSVVAEDGTASIWVPILDGAERVGVLFLRTPAVSEALVSRCCDLAGFLGELIVSKSQYGDTLLRARRLRPMTLAAELRWGMLPPLTFTGERVGIACVLEPAYEVAGDAFDYAVNAGVLHFAIFDAMGHGLEASRMASLTVAAYRWARRRRLDLAETFRAMDEALSDEFGEEQFVTAQFGTLDPGRGTLKWLNAGHPAPLLLRGGRVSTELRTPPLLPLGLGDVATSVAESSLEPGDRLLFFTDGVVEARSPGGERFGQERLIDLTQRALADQQTLAETVRRLVRSVQGHRYGSLDDDATILLVDWHTTGRSE